jgi:hypothetical protein
LRNINWTASKNRWQMGLIADSVGWGTGDWRWRDNRDFFEGDERLKALSAAGDPLERLSRVVDFEVFRSELKAALSRSDRSKGGRPPYDPVLMFKVLVLQTLYTLSDEQTEYQLKDRLSFVQLSRPQGSLYFGYLSQERQDQRRMTTSVPTETNSKRTSISLLYILKQPSERSRPMYSSSFVPWIRMLGILRFKARVPRGLSGLRGATAVGRFL